MHTRLAVSGLLWKRPGQKLRINTSHTPMVSPTLLPSVSSYPTSKVQSIICTRSGYQNTNIIRVLRPVILILRYPASEDEARTFVLLSIRGAHIYPVSRQRPLVRNWLEAAPAESRQPLQ